MSARGCFSWIWTFYIKNEYRLLIYSQINKYNVRWSPKPDRQGTFGLLSRGFLISWLWPCIQYFSYSYRWCWKSLTIFYLHTSTFSWLIGKTVTCIKSSFDYCPLYLVCIWDSHWFQAVSLCRLHSYKYYQCKLLRRPD